MPYVYKIIKNSEKSLKNHAHYKWEKLHNNIAPKNELYRIMLLQAQASYCSTNYSTCGKLIEQHSL